MHHRRTGSTALKIFADLAPIDQNVPGDNTNVLAISEDVEQSCLASARRAHKGCERSGLDITKDVSQ